MSDDDLPVALVFTAAAALACLMPAQSDTFFHLRAGESIWQAGRVPLTEMFSATFNGRPWLNHEWLSQLLLYALYASGGPFLIVLTCGVCAFAALAISYRLMRSAFEVRLALLVGLIVVMTPEWAPRPQALSLALLMLTAWLVIRDRILFLPILMVVWANAHGVVLLGIVLAGVDVAEALVWSRHRAARALAVAVLCGAAPILTPLGWAYWPRLFQTVSEARLLGIHEYRSAFADLSSLPFWLMFGVLASMVLTRVRSISSWGRADRILVLAAGAVGVASILSIRNAPSFALLAAPAIARLTSEPQASRGRPLAPGGYAFVSAAIIAALSVVAVYWSDGGARLGWKPVSSRALSAIEACGGPMYNEYGDGGTLMWFVRGHGVFVDGRIEAYPLTFLQRVRFVDLFGHYQSLFKEYQVRCAVTRTGSLLTRALQLEPTMRLWFSDDRWSVFGPIGEVEGRPVNE